ncbi:MAG: RNA methyltransferase [Candidatus Cloacimonetes bacterium]|nr:RNA methyltransferase [Candidatus Cloacimonadota bacterium]
MYPKISNNKVKELTKLNQKKYRQVEKKTVVEGVRLIDQLTDYKVTFEELIFSQDSKLDINKYSAKRILTANENQMKKLTETKTNQEIAAVISIGNIPIRDSLFLIYLDGIKDPGNLGTIFRTATAAGVSGIILSPDCCDIYNPKAIRASLGTVFKLPSETHEHSWLKSINNTIVSTTLQDSQNIFEVKKPANLMLVIGSEANGIREDILKISDYKVKIPILGEIESINAAVAAGIAIYHFINE